MLTPKKIVHRKVFNRYGQKRRGQLTRGAFLVFGEYGLKAVSSSWLTSRQIESARRVISRRCKGAKIHIRVHPSRPVTAKGDNATMGSGVGNIDYFMFPVKPGRIIFEVRGASEDRVKEAFRIAGHKLPFLTKMVYKDNF
ncbi:MAG: 50S ribosomal protein L16 [Patescibacteria group bacterium]